MSTANGTGTLGNLSVIAFHEKAGRSQVDSSLASLNKGFLLPPSHCRHASIRTLEERIVSLGACWASSIQPVLPPDLRPLVSRKSETWAWRLTQSPELGFGFCLSLPETILPLPLFYAAAAVVRRLLRSGSYTSPLTHR